MSDFAWDPDSWVRTLNATEKAYVESLRARLVTVTQERHRNVCGIRQRGTGYWWQSNTEHGTGWTGRIRQAWTAREAAMVILSSPHLEGAEIVELGPLGGDDGKSN